LDFSCNDVKRQNISCDLHEVPPEFSSHKTQKSYPARYFSVVLMSAFKSTGLVR
jgi:hypothetical protein